MLILLIWILLLTSAAVPPAPFNVLTAISLSLIFELAFVRAKVGPTLVLAAVELKSI
jgi:hypothetical protein